MAMDGKDCLSQEYSPIVHMVRARSRPSVSVVKVHPPSSATACRQESNFLGNLGRLLAVASKLSLSFSNS